MDTRASILLQLGLGLEISSEAVLSHARRHLYNKPASLHPARTGYIRMELGSVRKLGRAEWPAYLTQAPLLVLVAGLPAATATSVCVCVGPPDMIVMGSPTVLMNGLPAARLTSLTAHGGTVVLGAPTVLVGP